MVPREDAGLSAHIAYMAVKVEGVLDRMLMADMLDKGMDSQYVLAARLTLISTYTAINTILHARLCDSNATEDAPANNNLDQISPKCPCRQFPPRRLSRNI